MTPLQQAIAEFNARHDRELVAALSRCRSSYERDQCMAAYAKIGDVERDIIGQRFGLPPMLFYLGRGHR